MKGSVEKSMCILYHGFAGQSHGCSGGEVGEFF